mgnify:CR=1 FL=1
MNNEKRNIKLERDAKKNKIIVKYERTVEFDSKVIPTKITELENLIAQMEYHHQKLGADIESAKYELELLKQVEESR